MTKLILIIFLLLTVNAEGQNCPSGYQERKVKCGKEIIIKCVPINYSCSQCWAVETAPCPNYKTGGLDFYKSYEIAYETAEKNRLAALYSSNYNCIGADPRVYKIYLDDAKFCSVALTDLLNKVKPFLQRYKSEISNYKRYCAGKPYKPGAIVKEYQSMLKQAEANANKLEKDLNTLTDDNLDALQEEFENLQNEEIELNGAQSKYVAYINEPENQKKEQKTPANFDELFKSVTGENPSNQSISTTKRQENSNATTPLPRNKRTNQKTPASFDELFEEVTGKKPNPPVKKDDEVKVTKLDAGRVNNSISSTNKTSLNSRDVFGRGKYCFVTLGMYYHIDGDYNNHIMFLIGSVIELTQLDCALTKPDLLTYKKCAEKWYKNHLTSSGYSFPQTEQALVYMQNTEANCMTGKEITCYMTREQADKKREQLIQAYTANGTKFKLVE